MKEIPTVYEDIFFNIVPRISSQARSLREMTLVNPKNAYLIYAILFDTKEGTYRAQFGMATEKQLPDVFHQDVIMTDDFDLHWENKEKVYAIVKVGGNYFNKMVIPNC